MDDFIENYKVDRKYIKNSEKSIFNKYTIYIINLKDNILRRVYIKFLFRKMGINYNLIIVEKINEIPKNVKIHYTMDSINKFGCVSSHLWCIRDAINNKHEKFIIFEDDIIFKKNFNEEILKYLNDDNFEFDMLMLGALDINSKEHLLNLNKKHFYSPKLTVLGASANVYTLEFAKKVYEYKISNPIEEFDADFIKFYRKNNIKICYPNLVINEMSTTNLDHQFNFKTNSRLYQKYQTKVIKDQKININDYNFITIEFLEFCSENIYKFDFFKNILIDKYIEHMKEINKTIDLNVLNEHRENLLNSDYTDEDILNILHEYKLEKKCIKTI